MSASRLSPSPSRGTFARYGIHDVAYMRTVLVEGRVAYAVHAADGTCLWLDADREQAGAALKNHGVQLVSVH